MKAFLKIISLLWLVIILYLGIAVLLETQHQIERDKKFVETEIKPSVSFVTNFKTKNERLPTYKEYYTWQRKHYNDYSSDLTQQIDSLVPGLGRIRYIRKLTDVVTNDYSKFDDANWKKDFAIGVWRGEWNEYYFSWSNHYDTNNYSWLSAIISFIITLVVAVLPLAIILVSNRLKKSST